MEMPQLKLAPQGIFGYVYPSEIFLANSELGLIIHGSCKLVWSKSTLRTSKG